jgi:chromosome partitioning protein
MKKPVVVSVMNHKGGVGKTATVVNLAAGLARLKKKVLAIDLDTQMNLTHSLIGDLPEDAQCISDAVTRDNVSLKQIIRETPIEGLDIAPSGESMVNLELELQSVIGRENRLKKAISTLDSQKYDFILIDNAPHIGLATINSLIASQYFLVPVSAEYLPLVGLKYLLKNVDRIRTEHPTIQNLGFLLTMVDRRESISTDVENILRETFERDVFKSIVRVNTKLKACPQRKQSIFDAEPPSGKGHTDYMNVTKEFLKRVEKLNGN